MSSLILPLGLAMIVAIPWLINWTVGKEFLLSVIAVRIMVWGMLIASIFLWVRPALLSMGRPEVLTYANAFSAITMLGLSFIIVPKFGYIGSSLIYIYPYFVGHLITIMAYWNLVYKKT